MPGFENICFYDYVTLISSEFVCTGCRSETLTWRSRSGIGKSETWNGISSKNATSNVTLNASGIARTILNVSWVL